MKKTLIALSVLVAAGSVNAATVYEEDGYKFDISGDIEVNYKQDIGDDQNAVINLDDGDFTFAAESAVNEDIAVIAELDLSAEGAVEKGDDLYVGMKAGATTVTVGRQLTFVDSMGQSSDFEFGLDTAEAATSLATSGDQVIKVVYDDGQYYAGLDTVQYNTASADSDDKQLDLMAGARFGDAEVTAYYADGEHSSVDSDALLLVGSYAFGDASVKATFGDASEGDVDTTSFGVDFGYSMDKTSFNIGMTNMDTDGSDDYNSYYANVSYAVAKNATVFVELGDNDIDNQDMGYAAGLQVRF
jgi:predicted porin